MEIEEGYYDCVAEQSIDCDKGPCTSYTAYMNGQPAFTVYLYDNHPEVISVHEMELVEKRRIGDGKSKSMGHGPRGEGL